MRERLSGKETGISAPGVRMVEMPLEEARPSVVETWDELSGEQRQQVLNLAHMLKNRRQSEEVAKQLQEPLEALWSNVKAFLPEIEVRLLMAYQMARESEVGEEGCTVMAVHADLDVSNIHAQLFRPNSVAGEASGLVLLSERSGKEVDADIESGPVQAWGRRAREVMVIFPETPRGMIRTEMEKRVGRVIVESEL